MPNFSARAVTMYLYISWCAMPWHHLYDTLELYMETDLLLLSPWYKYHYICYDSVDWYGPKNRCCSLWGLVVCCPGNAFACPSQYILPPPLNHCSCNSGPLLATAACLSANTTHSTLHHPFWLLMKRLWYSHNAGGSPCHHCLVYIIMIA